MSTDPTFSAQLLGQTEKAANAILLRLLDAPGLTEPQWVTLTIAVTSPENLNRGRLAERVATAAKFSATDVDTDIAALGAAGLLELPSDGSQPVTVSAHGQDTFASIRAATGELTRRLWGDLPAEDLAAAARVLTAVLARANAELGHGQSTPNEPRSTM